VRGARPADRLGDARGRVMLAVSDLACHVGRKPPAERSRSAKGTCTAIADGGVGFSRDTR
jgi:hypothetical protein